MRAVGNYLKHHLTLSSPSSAKSVPGPPTPHSHAHAHEASSGQPASPQRKALRQLVPPGPFMLAHAHSCAFEQCSNPSSRVCVCCATSLSVQRVDEREPPPSRNVPELFSCARREARVPARRAGAVRGGGDREHASGPAPAGCERELDRGPQDAGVRARAPRPQPPHAAPRVFYSVDVDRSSSSSSSSSASAPDAAARRALRRRDGAVETLRALRVRCLHRSCGCGSGWA
eukprot:3932985-Rhodomonas_salina.1